MDIVIAGHIDHGKSTLIGRLLYDSGSIKDEKLTEIQGLIEEYKKNFEFAYFLDSFRDEMEEERTIDTISLMFKSKKRLYTITDVPGHKEFIRNMLTGASHADAAVLVVSAEDGIKEQTRRHLFLLNLIGVKRVIIFLNKMDRFAYNQSEFEKRFLEIETLMSGYKMDYQIIPGSAKDGENVFSNQGRMLWYSGPTLIEALDNVGILEDSKAPFRFIVQGTYKGVVLGRVESGRVGIGQDIIFEPLGKVSKLEGIMFGDEKRDFAEKGDSGLIVSLDVARGEIGCNKNSPSKATQNFLGEIYFVDGVGVGQKLVLGCGPKRVNCEIIRVVTKIDSESGEVLEGNAKTLGQDEAAVVQIRSDPVVLERFSDFDVLGRFVIYKGEDAVGVGVVLDTK
jgi:small GTP-binding protein